MHLFDLEINSRQPLKISIAEDLRNNEWITKDPAAGGDLFAHSGAQMAWPSTGMRSLDLTVR